ncbi:MAG: FadR family transcriptional regulator [Spirochaetales bacterium]|jgi:GntR family transcriptional regulator, transcriptional repressor for pyruvate dehydrogenase complex|nr:FadR family transcriptional regulator [Spirochaetales bacterium]
MCQEKIRQRTVVEQVMEEIRTLIASGDYKAGDRLPTEQELAERFGVGRSSIREAVKTFNYLGVLESKTSKGTFVCDSNSVSSEALTWSILLGTDDVFNLVETRAAIELWSILSLTAALEANPGEMKPVITKLEDLIKDMEAAVKGKEISSLAVADYEFHHEIISAGGNPLFSSLYKTLRSFMFEEIKKSYEPDVDITTLPGNHQLVLDAILTGDQSRVTEAVQVHISDTEKKLRKYFEAASSD